MARPLVAIRAMEIAISMQQKLCQSPSVGENARRRRWLGRIRGADCKDLAKASLTAQFIKAPTAILGDPFGLGASHPDTQQVTSLFRSRP